MSDHFEGLKVLGRVLVFLAAVVVVSSAGSLVAGSPDGGWGTVSMVLRIVWAAGLAMGGAALIATRRWGRMVTLVIAVVAAASRLIDAIGVIIKFFRAPDLGLVGVLLAHAFVIYLCYLVIEYLTEAGVSARLRAAVVPGGDAQEDAGAA